MTAEFTPKQVRHMFFEREEQRCFYCRRTLSWSLRGSMLAGGWSAHHRIDRGMGGRGKKIRVSCADGLILCGTGTTGCHGDFTHQKDRAIEFGISIPRLATGPDFAPTAVRVRDKAGRWFLLTENGRLVEIGKGNAR
jgi:hypothetical protein